MGDHSARYLKLLSRQYPTIEEVSTAIIDLSAQLNLLKGTEHFVSDLHGEHEAFSHVLRSNSGSIRRRINEIFIGIRNSLTESQKGVTNLRDLRAAAASSSQVSRPDVGRICCAGNRLSGSANTACTTSALSAPLMMKVAWRALLMTGRVNVTRQASSFST